MNFVSGYFLIFLPVVLLLYRRLSGSYRPWLLLLASYGFYAVFHPVAVLLLLVVTASTYVAGRYGRRSSLAYGIGLLIPLGSLFFCKYYGFLWENVHGFLSLPMLQILLPAGISFYTFQALAYVFDVRRGRLEPERDPLYMALFICFFPQLVAGPIERAGDLLPQLHGIVDAEAPSWREQLPLFLRGFAKKILVADYLAVYVTRVFDAPGEQNAWSAILGALLFTVQIYADFSGYSDIAVATAGMFGVRLSENFRHPYAATSVREFWKRWHRTLTRWFTDYVYIPLGGNRKGMVRTIVHLLVVFLLSGLWHGAAWHFLMWGLLHGVAMCIERLLQEKVRLPLWVSYCGTFAFVVVAWVFFRAKSIGDACRLLAAMVTKWQGGIDVTLAQACYGVLMILLVLRLDREDYRPTPVKNMLLYFSILAGWLFLLSRTGSNTFLYFQF
ncbi:MAG: MBOAT family protein [Lachnospiraceae bacterium]|nr:MBOAT family protein [Lachnospiraceae bacterium]